MEAQSNGALVPDNDNECENIQEVLNYAKEFQDELEEIAERIKQHEDSVRKKIKEKINLDEEILDLQAELGIFTIKHNGNQSNNDLKTIKQKIIAQHENSAAGTFLELSPHSHDSLKTSIIGIVATLGKFKDRHLSRVVSEFLGTETMLAIVCVSNKSTDVLETALGRDFDGRFSALFLNDLRSYRGNIMLNDPKKRLDLVKPRMPNGDFCCGFLGFAVNMIEIEPEMLSNVGGCGYGLRESLFYNVLSNLQVYDTKEHMLDALPCISNGAVSLDGSIVKGIGVFSPCSWSDLNLDSNDLGILFPIEHEESSSSITEKQIEEKNRVLRTTLEDIKTENEMLRRTKISFEETKAATMEFLMISSLYTDK